jgi:hypothetical protein
MFSQYFTLLLQDFRSYSAFVRRLSSPAAAGNLKF